MSKPFIVLGDKTDHGGTVVAVSSQTFIDNKPVARIGDKVVCPQCKGTFPIAAGDPTLIIDGQPVARHGDKTACGATLLSGQVRVHVADGGGGMGQAGKAPKAATAAGSTAVLSTDKFDEAFVLKSELTGEPLANRRYRITRANGAVETGLTDDNGSTHLVKSDAAETLCIELEEEVA